MGKLQAIGYNGQPVQQAFRRVDPPVDPEQPAEPVQLEAEPHLEPGGEACGEDHHQAGSAGGGFTMVAFVYPGAEAG